MAKLGYRDWDENDADIAYAVRQHGEGREIEAIIPYDNKLKELITNKLGNQVYFDTFTRLT